VAVGLAVRDVERVREGGDDLGEAELHVPRYNNLRGLAVRARRRMDDGRRARLGALRGARGGVGSRC
jgi:hypothetical protein